MKPDTVNVPREVIERSISYIRKLCVGHPYAKIAWPHYKLHAVADALEREALAVAPKVEQEPVAWRWRNKPDGVWNYQEAVQRIPNTETQPLYTHPAPASDELLEVLKLVDLSLQAMADEGIIADGSWSFVTDAIAKHKGPQS